HARRGCFYQKSIDGSRLSGLEVRSVAEVLQRNAGSLCAESGSSTTPCRPRCHSSRYLDVRPCRNRPRPACRPAPFYMPPRQSRGSRSVEDCLASQTERYEHLADCSIHPNTHQTRFSTYSKTPPKHREEIPE